MAWTLMYFVIGRRLSNNRVVNADTELTQAAPIRSDIFLQRGQGSPSGSLDCGL